MVILAEAAPNAGEFIGGGLALGIAIFLLVLGIFWLLLPFVIMSYVGKVRDEVAGLRSDVAGLKKLQGETNVKLTVTNQTLDTLADTATAMQGYAGSLDAHSKYTNQLLQWVGENQSGRQN